MGHGREQDETRGAIGKCQRIGRGTSASPGVADQDRALDAELFEGPRDKFRLARRRGVIVTLRP
jgi:hypothetical protein